MLKANHLTGFGLARRANGMLFEFGTTTQNGNPAFTAAGNVLVWTLQSVTATNVECITRQGAVLWSKTYHAYVSGGPTFLESDQGTDGYLVYSKDAASPYGCTLARISSVDGSLIWHKHFYDGTTDLAIHGSWCMNGSALYFCLKYNSTRVVLIKLDATTGALQWGRYIGNTANAFVRSISCDSGNVYISGYHQGASQAFVEKIDSAGTRVWAKSLATITDTFTRCIVRSDGKVAVACVAPSGPGLLVLGLLASDGSAFDWQTAIDNVSSSALITHIDFASNNDIVVAATMGGVAGGKRILADGSAEVWATARQMTRFSNDMAMAIPDFDRPCILPDTRFNTWTVGGETVTWDKAAASTFTAKTTTLGAASHTLSAYTPTLEAGTYFSASDVASRLTEIVYV